MILITKISSQEAGIQNHQYNVILTLLLREALKVILALLLSISIWPTQGEMHYGQLNHKVNKHY